MHVEQHFAALCESNLIYFSGNNLGDLYLC